MLEFKHVTFGYEDENSPLIDDLSFSVQKGDFVSIIGASGCGKSTIFRLINQLLTPSSGEILIQGMPVAKGKTSAGYMPQKDLLFPWRTVEKNLWLPMELQHLSKKEMHDKTMAILKDVGLTDTAQKFPRELSGGMRQRISFARTLLTNADLMLLDEPFSALDSLTRMAMQEWLHAQWAHFHKTIVFITHDVEEAIFLSGKIFVVTQTPIQELTVINVNLPPIRKREDLERPQIIALKKQLTEQLRKQVDIC